MASKNGSSNKYTSEFKFQNDIKSYCKPLISIYINQNYNTDGFYLKMTCKLIVVSGIKLGHISYYN